MTALAHAHETRCPISAFAHLLCFLTRSSLQKGDCEPGAGCSKAWAELLPGVFTGLSSLTQLVLNEWTVRRRRERERREKEREEREARVSG